MTIMSRIKVITLDSPTEEQLGKLVEMNIATFDDEPMINAMTGGIPEFKVDLFRLLLRAAALEGKIFACQKEESGEILSHAICFGPGTDFLGSEAQRALGAEDFFNKLPKETTKWLNEVNRPMSKKFIAETIGAKKKTDNWWIDLMTTLESERGKGYGSAIIKEICKKAKQRQRIVALNATLDVNVAFYHALGFDVIGTADRPSPFGTWTNNMMVWNSSMDSD